MRKRESSILPWPSGIRIMAISTRWPRSPVTRPDQSPSIIARPSSSRPSSAKNETAASSDSTTMPTLSIRRSATRPFLSLHGCLERLGARCVFDAAEGPVGREPLTDRAPERGVELRVARPYPGERTGVVVAVGQRVDVHAPDHVAARRIEHGVREPLAVAEVVGMALQVCAVLVERHVPRPPAVLPPGRRVDVLPRRRPRVVVLVVVLGTERLEHE